MKYQTMLAVVITALASIHCGGADSSTQDEPAAGDGEGALTLYPGHCVVTNRGVQTGACAVQDPVALVCHTRSSSHCAVGQVGTGITFSNCRVPVDRTSCE
jgi:hypothetical protein